VKFNYVCKIKYMTLTLYWMTCWTMWCSQSGEHSICWWEEQHYLHSYQDLCIITSLSLSFCYKNRREGKKLCH
jgi:hypothetical protein